MNPEALARQIRKLWEAGDRDSIRDLVLEHGYPQTAHARLRRTFAPTPALNKVLQGPLRALDSK